MSLNICPLSFPSKICTETQAIGKKVLCLCDIIVKRSYSERQFYGQPIIGNDLLVSIESLYKKKEEMRLAYIFSIVKTNIDECMCYATFMAF